MFRRRRNNIQMETFFFLFSMLHERVFQDSRAVEQTNVTHTQTHTHARSRAYTNANGQT